MKEIIIAQTQETRQVIQWKIEAAKRFLENIQLGNYNLCPITGMSYRKILVLVWKEICEISDRISQEDAKLLFIRQLALAQRNHNNLDGFLQRNIQYQPLLQNQIFAADWTKSVFYDPEIIFDTFDGCLNNDQIACSLGRTGILLDIIQDKIHEFQLDKYEFDTWAAYTIHGEYWQSNWSKEYRQAVIKGKEEFEEFFEKYSGSEGNFNQNDKEVFLEFLKAKEKSWNLRAYSYYMKGLYFKLKNQKLIQARWQSSADLFTLSIMIDEAFKRVFQYLDFYEESSIEKCISKLYPIWLRELKMNVEKRESWQWFHEFCERLTNVNVSEKDFLLIHDHDKTQFIFEDLVGFVLQDRKKELMGLDLNDVEVFQVILKDDPLQIIKLIDLQFEKMISENHEIILRE